MFVLVSASIHVLCLCPMSYVLCLCLGPVAECPPWVQVLNLEFPDIGGFGPPRLATTPQYCIVIINFITTYVIITFVALQKDQRSLMGLCFCWLWSYYQLSLVTSTSAWHWHLHSLQNKLWSRDVDSPRNFCDVFSCQSSSIPTLVTTTFAGCEWVTDDSSFRAIDATMRAHLLR